MPRLRQPPEWVPHTAVWSAWPRVPEYWEGAMEGARRELAAFFRAITDPDPATGKPRGEAVKILVWGDEARRSAEEALTADGIEHIEIPYGDVWFRDIAPVFVRDEALRATAVCFRYNGWGGKYLMEFDDAVAAKIAAHLRTPRRDEDWVFEGGSLDVDGEGTALTTCQCLLNPNRNPGLDEDAVARRLRDSIGVEKLIWLDEGLANDHTDGHIDNIARFLAPGKVACMRPSGTDDPNAAVLLRIEESLRAATDAAGRPLEVVTVPSPGFVPDAEGKPAPASHMNFYIANTRVLVPLYGTSYDEAALDALSPHFPGREIIGLRANHILVGGGSFHCVTREQPAYRRRGP
ncbi:MAG: agmatine deiminase family protein [Opitutales bacterium]|nr:agmatine deiminase family protein [Opitutales bacterium]